MVHFFRRLSRLRLEYANRLVLYSFFIPLFTFWMLAQLFGEWIWPLDTLTQFQVQFFLAFLFFAIVFLLAERRTGLHLSTLALLFIGFQFLPFYIKEKSPECKAPQCVSETLRIVQFNVFYQNQQMEKVIDWARRVAPYTDMIVLHEIPPKWKPKIMDLKNLYPYSFWTLDSEPYDMAVLSRMPISQRESWGGDEERNVAIRVHGTTDKHAIPFQIYAVHVASPLSLKAWKRRNRALRFHSWQLRDFPQPNQIMLGDFNTTAFSAWWRRLVRSSGLKDAQRGFGLMPTWSFFEPPNLYNGLQIDHMLVSPEIFIEERLTLADMGSDHLPVFTRLKVFKRQSATGTVAPAAAATPAPVKPAQPPSASVPAPTKPREAAPKKPAAPKQ